MRAAIANVRRLVFGLCCVVPLAVHAQSPRQWIASDADRPLVGVQIKIDRFTREAATRVKATGFAFVRLGVWANAMKDAAYRKQVATAFAAAHSAGIAVIVTVRSTATLVQPDADQEVRVQQLRAAAAELVQVVKGIVGIYGHDVLAVEIWNEPELRKYWPTGDLDSAFPVYMRAVCEGLLTVRESTHVIGFAFATPPMPGSRSDILLRSVETASPHCLDAVSWHAYGKSAREIRAVSDYVRARYGVPTVVTEWGASSGALGGESGQVSTYRSFLANLDALNTPLISIYEWQDTANAQNIKERHFGLVDAAGKDKAALDAVKPMLGVP